MEKIGNIEIYDYMNQLSEDIDMTYNKILENVKDDPDYLEGTWLEGKANWIEMKEMLSQRKNVIDWFPMEEDAEVLEIMSGCGALSGCIASKVKSLTCVDVSKTKSKINAYRNREYKNISVYVSDYKTFLNHTEKKYDYIIWINDVVDYKTIAPEYESLKKILKNLSNLLKENGKLVCAVNNPLSLRSFAGYAEEYSGKTFEGLYGYPSCGECKGFTKIKLEEILTSAKYKNIEWYYPYPDYMFPILVYSDYWKPKKGDLWMNMCNLQHDRMVLFDEQRAYDFLIENNMFSQFSNSYLIIAERE